MINQFDSRSSTFVSLYRQHISPKIRPRNIAAEQTTEIENWKRDVMLEIFTMRRNLTNLENQVRNHPF